MAILEYTNHTHKIEAESEAQKGIVLNSREFRLFLQALEIFNQSSVIETLELIKNNGTYDYNILTKNGKETSYVFHRDGDDFEIELTTNGTSWVPFNLLLNSELRETVFTLIRKFEVFRIEVEYY